MSEPQSNADQFLNHAVIALIKQLGISAFCHRRLIVSGRNNRVSRLDCGSQRFLLKQYFSHPKGNHDRMHSDVAFSRFAWERGICQVAEPLVTDEQNRLAIFEWISGRALSAGDIDKSHMNAAVAFFRDLNSHRDHPDAALLPPAAESCFSIAEHLRCVEQRVRLLTTITPDSEPQKIAIKFVQNQLLPAWDELSNQVTSKNPAILDEELPSSARCLSPSDFGFHNAILDETGQLRFFDFEYAGWDDPAKMICDFFCQPEVPVPMQYLDAMTTEVVTTIPGSENLRDRVRLLWPVYQIKWCTIAMNEFLPANAIRREFSGAGVDEARLQQQLTIAGEFLANMHA